MSVIPAGDTCTCTEKCEAGKVRTDCPVCKNDCTGCVGKETKPSEPEQPETEQPKKDTGSIGTIIFVVLALLAVVALATMSKSCVQSSRRQTRNLRMTVTGKDLIRMRLTANRNICQRMILTIRKKN